MKIKERAARERADEIYLELHQAYSSPQLITKPALLKYLTRERDLLEFSYYQTKAKFNRSSIKDLPLNVLSPQEIELNSTVEKFTNKIQRDIKEGNYQPATAVEVYSTRTNSTILIPCVRDRVVQQALTYLINPIHEGRLCAERPKRRPSDAITNIKSDFEEGRIYALKTFPCKSYRNINRELIFDYIEEILKPDNPLIDLIKTTFLPPKMRRGGVEVKGKIPGSIFNPLHSTLTMMVMDVLWEDVKRVNGYNAELVRYGDDYLIMMENEDERVKGDFLKIMNRLNLTTLKSPRYFNLGSDNLMFLDHQAEVEEGKIMLKPHQKEVDRVKRRIRRGFKDLKYYPHKEVEITVRLSEMVGKFLNKFQLCDEEYLEEFKEFIYREIFKVSDYGFRQDNLTNKIFS